VHGDLALVRKNQRRGERCCQSWRAIDAHCGSGESS
jgi:hypothetical protein